MQLDKEVQHRDLQGAGGIGVDAVVGLNDDEALVGRRGCIGEGAGEGFGSGA